MMLLLPKLSLDGSQEESMVLVLYCHHCSSCNHYFLLAQILNVLYFLLLRSRLLHFVELIKTQVHRMKFVK